MKPIKSHFFIILVRWLGTRTSEQSSEGSVRDLHEYPVKKEFQPEE